ncbi:MAG: hypothetical protein VX107_07580, partial [Pseudomonadota bacterium]|nr:hypothetical protein [Pseudomonadota bacterium]
FAVFVRQSPQLTLDQFMAQSVGVWWPVCGEANYQTRIFNATDEGIQILIFCLKSTKLSGKKRLWFRHRRNHRLGAL